MGGVEKTNKRSVGISVIRGVKLKKAIVVDSLTYFVFVFLTLCLPRANASSEVEYDDAWGTMVGPEGGCVLNTSFLLSFFQLQEARLML